MPWIVLVLVYLTIVPCLAVLVTPKFLPKIIGFLSVGKRLYLVGFIQILLGALLLFLASQSRLWGYVVIVGLIAAGLGLSIFFFALKRTKELLWRTQNQSNLLVRLWAISGLIIWVLLVYALLL